MQNAAIIPPAVSYRDVRDAPENMRAEILDGELVMQARPMPRHDMAQSRLAMLIGPAYEFGRGGPGGWWIRAEPELHLGDPDFRTLVPDLAGWRRETMPNIPLEGRYRTAPDWVCEILSPATERRDRAIKTRIYAEVGVKHLWMVNPAIKMLEAYELREGAWMLLGAQGDAQEAAFAPFDAAPFSLADLWPETQT